MGTIRPGEVWRDTGGDAIQAHGGGLLEHDGVVYWYGEHKGGPTINQHRVDVIGVSCYSSRDYVTWTYEGLALPAVADDPTHDLHPSRVCERPKVVFCEATGDFVMWMHIDTLRYEKAHAGVAVSDSPTGPFRYLGSGRPDGTESRDLAVFVDDDGAAYLVFGSDGHTVLRIARLSDDYRSTTGVYSDHLERAGPPTGREAPALCRRGDRYHLITSGTTGWDPNPSEHAVASDIDGPWETLGNPFVGAGSETSFRSQGTFLFPNPGAPGELVLMGDRWNRQDLGDSRYVWLPVEFDGDRAVIRWRDEWELTVPG